MPSSVIAYMHYNETSQTLVIGFVTGVAYEYKHVPHATYQALKNAKSKGTYLNKHIKGSFEYNRIK